MGSVRGRAGALLQRPASECPKGSAGLAEPQLCFTTLPTGRWGLFSFFHCSHAHPHPRTPACPKGAPPACAEGLVARARHSWGGWGAPRDWGSGWGGALGAPPASPGGGTAPLLLFSQQTSPPPALVPARLPPLCLEINKKSADEGLLDKAEWHAQNVCPAWGDRGKDASLPGPGSRDPAMTAGPCQGRAVPRTTGLLGHAWGQGSSWGASRTWAQPRDPLFGVWAAVVVFFVPRFLGR